VGSEAAVAAGELLAVTRAELPTLAKLSQREQLLVAMWLVSLRSARTHRAYFGDLTSWLAWLSERQLDPLTASRAQVAMWVRATPTPARNRQRSAGGWRRCPAGTATWPPTM
jgi:hypothetical protein